MNGSLNSLGIDKPAAETRVVVAMSGGVDSSTTAALLAEQGYDVVGITLQLYDDGAARGRAKTCCAGQDIHDARRVAEAVGIPHYVLDYQSRFRQDVIDAFADSYVNGETPIPCVLCNQTVKFRDLLGTARDLGADALATGHYVRRVMGEGGPELHAAADAARDQSYFLFATTREQLAYLRFPLGGLTKEETRALARRFDLPVAMKPDSQDICFVPDGNYADVVAKLRPGAAEPGDIVDTGGRVLGRHGGIIRYTVGQRRGLGIGGEAADGEPLYVVRIEPGTRRVVVGPRAALGIDRIRLTGLNWIGETPRPGEGIGAQIKVRSTRPPVPAVVTLDGVDGLDGLDGRGGGAVVMLETPETGVAPGQACVVYDGPRVLGGGWIARENRAEAANHAA
jgi:tRNA-specific 2-thiouridylase